MQIRKRIDVQKVDIGRLEQDVLQEGGDQVHWLEGDDRSGNIDTIRRDDGDDHLNVERTTRVLECFDGTEDRTDDHIDSQNGEDDDGRFVFPGGSVRGKRERSKMA